MVIGEWAENSAPKKYTPSYLGLSCAINGYRPINKYDTSNRENLSNLKAQGRTSLYREYANRGPLFYSDANQNTLFLRSSHLIEPRSRSLSSDRALGYRRQTSRRMESPHRANNLNNLFSTHLPHRVSSTIPNFPPVISNHTLAHEESTTPVSHSNTRSSIQERIERLYGSSAGFRINKFEREEKKEASHSTISSIDEFPSVFRHLTPEFRHQLPLRPRTTLLSSRQNNNLKPLKPSGDEVDCHMNGHHADRLPAVSDRITKKSEENPTKSWYSFRSDIQSVGKDDDKPVKSIANDFNDLDLNKNLNSINNSSDSEVKKIPSEPKKDGIYFLKVVEQEIKNLEDEISKIDNDLKEYEDEMTEETKGKLLATSGKAKLLIRKKIKQFQGLCQKNIDKNCTDEFPTTDEDLAGFWDMVYIQVENVKQMFSEVENLRSNDWKEDIKAETPAVKPVQRKHPTSKTKPAASSSKSNGDLESTKSKSKANEERRRQMRQDLISKRKEAANMKKTESEDGQNIQFFV